MTLRFLTVLGIAVFAATTSLAQTSRSADVQYKAAQYKEQVEGDLKGAITEYEKVVSGPDRALAAQALLQMADIHEKLGTGEADRVYQRLIRDFSEQTSSVAEARTKQKAALASTTRAVTTKPSASATVQPSAPPIVVAADRLMTIALYDRKGTLLLRETETTTINIVSISPDGQRIAYSPDNNRVMVLDVASRTRSQVGIGYSPVGFSPDGSRLVHLDSRGGRLAAYTTSAFGAGDEDLLVSPSNGVGVPPGRSPLGLYHWSGDGRFVVAGMGENFVAVPVAAGDRTPRPILPQNLGYGAPRLSPDSRYAAYTSNEGRGKAVLVSRWTETLVDGRQWRVSPNGALGMIRWRQDGGELYYVTSDGSVMAIPTSTAGERFEAGTPVRLFGTEKAFPLNNVVGQHADVSADGERFVFLLATAD